MYKLALIAAAIALIAKVPSMNTWTLIATAVAIIIAPSVYVVMRSAADVMHSAADDMEKGDY